MSKRRITSPQRRPLAAIALIASVLSTGCYYGRSPGAKSAAYASNIAWIVLGGAFLLSETGGGSQDSSECGADGCHYVGGGGVIIGLPLVGGGLLGLLVNGVVPTRHPADPPTARRPVADVGSAAIVVRDRLLFPAAVGEP